MDSYPTDNSDKDTGKNIGALRRHDLIVSTILWVVSIFVLLDSLRMTFNVSLPNIDENVWLVAPGFLPMILSGGLVIMFSFLIWLSIRQGDLKGHFSTSAFIKAITDPETVSKLIQMALLCIFVFVLLTRLHFGVASALYLFAAMSAARAAKLWQIALISILFAAMITYVFGTLMKIPLP